MIRLYRHLLAPFIIGGIACAALLIVWTLAVPVTGASLRPPDAGMAALIILPFKAIGLILLLPIALALRDRSLPALLYPAVLTIVGAAIGIVVVLPISDATTLPHLALPAACGAVSALIWFAVNRDPAQIS